jgi:hypothetical protein
MHFVTIPAAKYELGWRFTSCLPKEAIAGMSGFLPLTGPMTWHSKQREAVVASFEIAIEAIHIEELIGPVYEVDDSVWNIETLCGLVDGRLAQNGLRLPSEDEFEAACGGSLFAWGMNIPDGIPYGLETSFEEHQKPNAYGLTLNSNPYRTELTRCALKLGDGGVSICHSYPWPLAWLALSPCFHMLDEHIEDCFLETLEETYVRPVKL